MLSLPPVIIQRKMEILTRKHYADIVDSWIGKGNIIALVGSRRVGKSFVLKDFMQRHKDDPDVNIIFIDKEKKAFKDIKTKDDLDNWIETRFIPGKHNIILIDEVQQIEHFEESVCNWYSEDNTDVIITGSNSKMLSGELATLIAGRYVEVRIHPLTYSEFLEFHNLSDSDENLMTYLTYGGLPGLRKVGLDSDEQVWAYLTSVFNTIMLKDIIERHEIRNIPFLNNLIAFYADTTGKLTSANSIAKYMKSQHENVSANLVLLYRGFYAEAYLLDIVPRYDIHGKKIFESNEKVYWDDLGLRNLKAEGGMDSQASALSRLRSESGCAECRGGGFHLHQARQHRLHSGELYHGRRVHPQAGIRPFGKDPRQSSEIRHQCNAVVDHKRRERNHSFVFKKVSQGRVTVSLTNPKFYLCRCY